MKRDLFPPPGSLHVREHKSLVGTYKNSRMKAWLRKGYCSPSAPLLDVPSTDFDECSPCRLRHWLRERLFSGGNADLSQVIDG